VGSAPSVTVVAQVPLGQVLLSRVPGEVPVPRQPRLGAVPEPQVPELRLREVQEQLRLGDQELRREVQDRLGEVVNDL